MKSEKKRSKKGQKKHEKNNHNSPEGIQQDFQIQLPIIDQKFEKLSDIQNEKIIQVDKKLQDFKENISKLTKEYKKMREQAKDMLEKFNQFENEMLKDKAFLYFEDVYCSLELYFKILFQIKNFESLSVFEYLVSEYKNDEILKKMTEIKLNNDDLIKLVELGDKYLGRCILNLFPRQELLNMNYDEFLATLDCVQSFRNDVKTALQPIMKNLFRNKFKNLIDKTTWTLKIDY